jgi:hypothetical protein
MLQTNLLELSGFLKSKVVNMGDLKKATSIALGIGLSFRLQVPTSDGGHVAHYDSVLVHSALKMISDFNETILVDVDLAARTCRSYWLMRYAAATRNPTGIASPNAKGSFTEKIFGMHHYAIPEVQDFLENNSEVMVVIINRMSMVLGPAEQV